MTLHWVIALLLMFTFGLGERTEHMPRGAALFAVFQLHKSVGITVLILSLWRLGLRFGGGHPRPLEETGLTAFLARLVHWLFYAIMILVPITGWILVSTAKVKIPTLLFGTIPLPHLPVSGHETHEIAEGIHKLLATVGIPVLLLLHVAGAVRHQLLLKERLVERMAPVGKAGAVTIGLLFASIAGAFMLGKFAPVAEAFAGLPAQAASAGPPAVTEGPANITAPEETGNATEAAAPAVAENDAANSTAAVEQKDLANAAWTVLPGGRLVFAVAVSGQKVNGSFGRWSANIAFNPDAPEKGSIRATIDLASVASGDSERDGMLATGDFFDTAAHPKASFVSQSIRSLGGNRYEARGLLTIKGVARPLRLPFTLEIKGDSAVARGSTSFDRRSFKVGQGQFEGTDEVGSDITVSLDFKARRKG